MNKAGDNADGGSKHGGTETHRHGEMLMELVNSKVLHFKSKCTNLGIYDFHWILTPAQDHRFQAPGAFNETCADGRMQSGKGMARRFTICANMRRTTSPGVVPISFATALALATSLRSTRHWNTSVILQL